MYMEFINNFKQKARMWLLKFFNEIFNTGLFPKEFKRVKIIALVKPGKEGNIPSEYLLQTI